MWRGIGATITVAPAQAGAQAMGWRWMHWIPACAGTTIQANIQHWRSACRVPGAFPEMRRKLSTVAPAQAGAQADVARNWRDHHRRPRLRGNDE